MFDCYLPNSNFSATRPALPDFSILTVMVQQQQSLFATSTYDESSSSFSSALSFRDLYNTVDQQIDLRRRRTSTINGKRSTCSCANEIQNNNAPHSIASAAADNNCGTSDDEDTGDNIYDHSSMDTGKPILKVAAVSDSGTVSLFGVSNFGVSSI